MAGYTPVAEKAILDWYHPTTANADAIAYSVNGTSEFAGLARTAVGATGWAAATGGSPSVKSNGVALTTAAATGAGTVTHFAVFSATSAGVQKTDWQPLATSKPVGVGDQLSWAVGELDITLD